MPNGGGTLTPGDSGGGSGGGSGLRADRALATDPTALTTDALRREIAGLRELLETKVEARANINGSLIEALRSAVDDLRVTVDARIEAEVRVGREHDIGVERQLLFLESQRQEQKQDTAKAVEAALAAAKEAVNITAANTKEQIAALTTSFQTTMSAFGEKLEDVKNATVAISERKVGATEQRSGMNESTRMVIAIGGFIILVLGFIAARGGL